MYEQVKSFFRFNKQERFGAVLLILIISGFNLWFYFRPTPGKIDISYTILEETITVEKKQPQAVTPSKKKNYSKSNSKKYTTKKYQKPSNKKAEYESKWNDYPKNENKKDTVYESTYESKYLKKKNEPIDINTATAEQWETLSGIGPVLSKRIVKFRDGLGGFYKVDQVAETFGLPPETFELIKPLLHIKTPQKRVSINTLSAEQLDNFRFISLKEANVIIRFRDQHGPFESIDDLRKVVILEEEQIAKLEPYISFE